MELAECVNQAFRAATGKLPTFGVGSKKWNNLVASINFYIGQWAREPGVDWNSLYDPAYSLGNITATATFDLGDEVRKLSQQEGDAIRITRTGSTQYTDFDVVSSDRLKEYASGNYVAQIGKTIRFNKAFTSANPLFGGAITAPVYLYPETMTRSNDTIPVDDPNWLVLMVAADYVRNDITRKDLRADLVDEANASMQRMKTDNNAQIETAYTSWSPTGHIGDDYCY